MPLQRHYRTAVFFIISFLTSIILYFFSIPLVGWASALVLYTGIVRLLVYQYLSFQRHEKRKDIHAEDILAGKKVIQEAE
jgi:membrane protein implicated in regulation of membrane protease activity